MNRLFFAGFSALLLSTAMTSVAQADSHTTDAPSALPEIEALDDRRPEASTEASELNPDPTARPNELPEMDALDDGRPEGQDSRVVEVERSSEPVSQQQTDPGVNLPNMHVLREYNSYPYSVR